MSSQYVGTGNVSSNVQMSTYVRARTNTECNGQAFAPGALRNADLKNFGKATGLPDAVLQATTAATETNAAILYRFQHFKTKRMVIHGFVLTKTETQSHELIRTFATGLTPRSQAIVAAMAKIVSNRPGTRRLVDVELTPLVRSMAIKMAAACDEESSNAIGRIATEIAGKADGGRDGNLWRSWTAVIEDRDLWATIDRPGVAEAIATCNIIANATGPDGAERIRRAMRAIEATAVGTAEGLADRRHDGLRLADAAIRGLATHAERNAPA